jgi:hypothetical protein
MLRAVENHPSEAPPFSALPLHLERRASRASAASRLLLLVPAVAAAGVVLVILAINVAGDPDAAGRVLERPAAAAQIAVALALWLALFVGPCLRALAGLSAGRRIEIADGLVRVEDWTLFGRRRWSEPLASYSGVAHHIRASLSGVAHEVVLVHPGARSVTLLAAEKVSQSTIDRAAALLGLPEVPARALYEPASIQIQPRRSSPALSLPPAPVHGTSSAAG